MAFIGTTQWLGEEKHDGVEVVLGKGKDQFDIVRLARTDACNYDLFAEDIIQRLEKYHHSFGIDIFHAETDTIEFDLIGFPTDLAAFAKDLFDFCPDIVLQGVGTVEALEEAIADTGKVYLWWD